MKRLDRAIVSIKLLTQFPNATVEHYQVVGSDHRPILLSTGGCIPCRKRGFKFEDKWTAMDGFLSTIHEGWQSPVMDDRQFQLHTRFTKLQRCLLEWSKGGVTNCRRRIKGYMDQLEVLMRGNYDEIARN